MANSSKQNFVLIEYPTVRYGHREYFVIRNSFFKLTPILKFAIVHFVYLRPRNKYKNKDGFRQLWGTSDIDIEHAEGLLPNFHNPSSDNFKCQNLLVSIFI